ncbi:Alpha-1,2-mannosyltransferase MNN23 [Candida viswanathii]|uniref:Alpha-1,2-mannosyltransferase MNN23 n=1 Tax=Candida viswanathii TaxID=5486 RepID=A0A367YDI4_9ASCO|nr:Alpha-1,2-mannosyltransferase MNN23 [Candida viswanathii]
MSKILHILPRHRAKTIGVLIILGILVHTVFRYSSLSSEGYDLDMFQDETGREQLDPTNKIIDDRPDLDKPAFDALLEEQEQKQQDGDKEEEKYDDIIKTPVMKPVTAHVFWKHIFETFDKYELDLGADPGKAVHYIDKSKHKPGEKTKEVLLSKAEVAPELIEQLKLKHHGVVEDLPEMMPDSVYKKGSKGVVIIGGTRFSWLAYLALVSLRESGSKLPVEIIMPTKKDYERETEFCKKILPDLNAACVVVDDVLGEAVMKGRKFKSFQFKALALVVSSFEHILLLDSDNMIVTNPDKVFESKVYQDYGMITWPDYWKRTISPIYYDLAEIEINDNKRVRYDRFPLYVPPGIAANIDGVDKPTVPYHDLEGAISDLSTESGQLIINKRTHGETILLALYYNMYGPNLFYKLFSLGEQGEGDKDTFVAAAVVSGQDYYQVKSFIRTFGYVDNDGKFQGVAMGQRDPLEDHKQFESKVLKSFLEDETTKQLTIPQQIEKLKTFENEVFHQHNDIPLFTIHCNYPKLDPLQYMSRDDLYDSEKKKLKYKLYSGLSYTKQELRNGELEDVQVNFEYEQWAHIHDILCVKRIHFVHFADKDMTELCEFINNQVRWLASSE